MSGPAYPIHKWRWRINDPARPGRRYVTRHHMTEAEALATDPAAERVENSLMVIEAPGTAHSSGVHGRIS